MADKDRITAMEQELDALFATARRQSLPLDEALTDRILADALALQSAPAAPARPVPAQAVRPGRLAQFFALLGGWPAVAGLATATVAGLWIGTTSPDMLYAQTGLFESASSSEASDLYLVDAFSAFDALPAGG